MLNKRDSKAYPMPIPTGLSDTSGSSPAAPPLDYPKTVANVFAYCSVPPNHSTECLDGLLRPPPQMSRQGNGTSLGSTGDGRGGMGDDGDDADDDDDCLTPSQHPNDLPNDYSMVDTTSAGGAQLSGFGQMGQQQDHSGGSYGSGSGSKTPVLLQTSQQQPRHHLRLSGLDGPPEVRFIMPQDDLGMGGDDLGDVVSCVDKNQDSGHHNSGGGARDIDGMSEHSGTPQMVRPASTDGHFVGTDLDPRSYHCVRSGLLKVPTAKHHPNSNANSNLSMPFGGPETSRCASPAGMYANSHFNSNISNNLHTRHASGSAAYLRSHVMLAPPSDGTNNGVGGTGSYLSDSDLNSNMHHTGSVSSSPGLRTKSISPTTSSAAVQQQQQHDVLFAHSRPQHQMVPHLQDPSQQPQPDLLFCPPITTTSGSNDFLPMNSSDADMPLRLSRSPAMNYSNSGGGGGGMDGQSANSPWGGNQQQHNSGSVLAPVMDDYSSSSPLYLSTMRGDNVGDGSGTNNPGSVQNCGGGATGDSYQARSGGVQQQRQCIPGTMSGLGSSGFPSQTDLPLVNNFNTFATVDPVNSITGSLNPNSNPPSLTLPHKRPRRH
ncbi:unnamed protein product [Rodentolepis nana]|uniref:PSP1 C-terminal domain-containing protein n=1 Tax=Rodentolepis nana TaxID=102285 RepID=A0A0R3TWR4_RODNA|nr:unnamed protein product [Rodentolepis nana]